MEVPYGEGNRMLTVAQVCEWFGVEEDHVRKLRAKDKIPYRKVGGSLRFPEQELEEWSKPKAVEEAVVDLMSSRPAHRRRTRRAAASEAATSLAALRSRVIKEQTTR